MMSIEERIQLNRLEYIDLLRNYCENVFSSLIFGRVNYKDILYLISKLKEYQVELKDETEYLKYLLIHSDNIKEEELNRVLELIDENNKETFLHYDSIGDDYSDSLYDKRPLRYKDTISLSNNYKLTDEIIGVTLTKQDIDNYYSDYMIYRLLRTKAKVRDYGKELFFYGAYPQLIDERIMGVKLIVPPVKNLKTALINIHEYKHGIDLMNSFGKQMECDEYYEERAKKEEQDFIEHYVRNK